MDKKWFGREPALVISALASILAVLVGFGFPGLNDGMAAAIVALGYAAAGVWTAAHVRPVAPTLFTGLIAAGAALLAEFGLHATQQQVTLLAAAVSTLMVLVFRAQVTPAHDPLPISGIAVVKRGDR